MANDNNKVRELVPDPEQRISELDASTWPDAALAERGADSGEDPTQFDLDTDDPEISLEDLKDVLQARTGTIERLQFDVERLRSLRVGLETEVEARAAQTRQLTSQVEALNIELRKLEQVNIELTGQLKAVRKRHQEEIRTLRFELGEAAQTLAQHELINEQLTTDLQDTRGFKAELERMLAQNDSRNHERIEQLEREVDRLETLTADYERELANKRDTIDCLLDELSTAPEKNDPISELEAVIQEIDDHVAKRFDDGHQPDRDRRMRVLIGRIDDKEIRFPLFKDRLSIGRARQNDIQLHAPYISRRHAVVVTEGDTTRVIDWGSKNGVYVNSARVTEHFLSSGDIVTIGTTEFRYEERRKR